MNATSPIGQIRSEERRLAERPSTLHGKVVGVIDNQKENARLVLTTLIDELQKREKLGKVPYFTKSFPAEPARGLPEIVGQCDAIINGVGH